jgi:hypothetical protein
MLSSSDSVDLGKLKSASTWISAILLTTELVGAANRTSKKMHCCKCLKLYDGADQAMAFRAKQFLESKAKVVYCTFSIVKPLVAIGCGTLAIVELVYLALQSGDLSTAESVFAVLNCIISGSKSLFNIINGCSDVYAILALNDVVGGSRAALRQSFIELLANKKQKHESMAALGL